MNESKETDGVVKWYAMRDLKRANAKQPAYKLLESKGIEVFTPTKWKVVMKMGRQTRVEIPIIPDLLFAHDKKENLDPIVESTDTLQYRYLRGGHCMPMIIPDADMERFVNAVKSSESPKYFFPDEITPQMYGRKIRIIGGPMNGYEGYLQTTRGSKVKRLLVEVKGILAVSVEVKPEYIELI